MSKVIDIKNPNNYPAPCRCGDSDMSATVECMTCGDKVRFMTHRDYSDIAQRFFEIDKEIESLKAIITKHETEGKDV